MKEIIKALKDFYANRTKQYNEQKPEKYIALERYITLNYLKKYVNKKSNVIEIGAGIRSYAVDLSKIAKNVIAVDVFEENIKRLREKDIKNLNGYVADIVDLKEFADNSFDVVFVDGVMSHLFDEKERQMAISESIRICKNDGYLIYSFVSNTGLIVRYGLLKGNIMELKNKISKDYTLSKTPEDIYATYYVDQFNEMFGNKNLKHITNVSTDGCYEILKEYTNKLTDEEFEVLKRLQLGICERKDMIGLGTQILSIYRKS